ncbi:hypothetical protein SLE2022_112870 [Rubroshorea leprosula]
MQKQNIVHGKVFLSLRKNVLLHREPHFRISCIMGSLQWRNRVTHADGCIIRAKILSMRVGDILEIGHISRPQRFKGLAEECQGELSDEDDDLCPVDCVREFKTDEEFLRILEKAKETNSLVVVDFYRTSCGSCKYIEQGFSKLCKGSGDREAAVIFLKHNVIDEYDEQSEVAERLRIRAVPLFHFYKNGVLLEAFATREKERIIEAILKYTSPTTRDAIA